MKLGIVVDSSSGITKKEAEKRGWGFLPLYISIDEKEYADGIDITTKEYYEKVTLESSVRTSATPPGIIEEILSKMSKEFDKVLVYTISKELSSQNSNVQMIAKNFKNVYVIKSKSVGYTIVKDLNEIENLALQGEDWEEILKISEELSSSNSGLAVPENLNWLVKGGRASAAAAGMANLLKIVPIISFSNGKLDKFGKGRVFQKTVLKIAKELKEKYPDGDFVIYNANNKNIWNIQNKINEKLGLKIEIKDFPSVIVNHIGIGAIAIIVRYSK